MKQVRALSLAAITLTISYSGYAQSLDKSLDCFEAQILTSKAAQAAQDKGRFAEALRILEKATAEGNPLAKSQLCLFHVTKGVPDNLSKLSEAKRICSELAYEDIQEGQNILAKMYLYGMAGIQKDFQQSVFWFEKAADQGDSDSQFYLGLAFATGEGTRKDYVTAYKWLNLAVAGGEDQAKKILENLQKIMLRDEIAEAQRLSREWVSRKSDYDYHSCDNKQ